jgi:hypothetical protein
MAREIEQKIRQNFQSRLKVISSKYGLNIPINISDPFQPIIDPHYALVSCASGIRYTTVAGDSCDKIATMDKVSSAALFIVHDKLFECENIAVSTKLYMPFQCGSVHTIKSNDTYIYIKKSQGVGYSNNFKGNSTYVVLGMRIKLPFRPNALASKC